MAKQPKWTKKEDELLKKMFTEGFNDAFISKALNRSLDGVRTRRTHIGLVNEPIWNDSRIKEEILNCMDQLLINRMPTSSELKNIDRQDLHNKICKTKKYSGWAKELNLKTTECETRIGQESEERIMKIMENKGFEVVRMSTKYPYDLLVNGCVKVDVKSAKAHHHFQARGHTFAINKINPTCDVYVVAAIDEQNEFERILVIPSHFLKMKSLNIGKESKWNHFLGKWDIIRKYSEFYNKVM